MLLSFDVDTAAIAEHDHWHSFEHLPERLAIPGFLRGTRWVAVEGGPRYLVLYEVESLATLNSAAYLERLNAPTPWTARMMTRYAGMRRGLCSVVCSEGFGLGRLALLVRLRPSQGDGGTHAWLCGQLLPELRMRPGLSSAHLLQGAATPAMTNEQRIRGADATVDSALVVTAHDELALKQVADGLLGAAGLPRQGAADIAAATYTLHHSLTRAEVAGGAHPADAPVGGSACPAPVFGTPAT